MHNDVITGEAADDSIELHLC